MKQKLLLLGLLWFTLMLPASALTLEKHDFIMNANITVTNGTVRADIVLYNMQNQTRTVSLYSYVYSNGSSVSGAWTQNLQEHTLAPLGSVKTLLENNVYVSGTHDYKIRIKEDKTVTDAKARITIKQSLKKPDPVSQDELPVSTPVVFAASSALGIVALWVATRKV
ncbi:hypothetical protein COT72_03565 [archaeon CG10_big_fil_rev_8_21_14_0_10_43_11]|nr:MAG: hypothetical protein COT72_03565 [archaeon CG10_big_fil_rev_8_21_14_0_10_43_11]